MGKCLPSACKDLGSIPSNEKCYRNSNNKFYIYITFYFLRQVSRAGQPQNLYVAESDLKPLTFLLPPCQWWGYRCVPLCPGHGVMGVESRASCTWGQNIFFQRRTHGIVRSTQYLVMIINAMWSLCVLVMLCFFFIYHTWAYSSREFRV